MALWGLTSGSSGFMTYISTSEQFIFHICLNPKRMPVCCLFQISPPYQVKQAPELQYCRLNSTSSSERLLSGMATESVKHFFKFKNTQRIIWKDSPQLSPVRLPFAYNVAARPVLLITNAFDTPTPLRAGLTRSY